MEEKKHIEKKSDRLLDIFNEILRKEGISTDEMPFYINKIQFRIRKTNAATAAVDNPQAVRKCVKWEKKLVKRTDPHTGETIIQLERVCVQYEDGI